MLSLGLHACTFGQIKHKHRQSNDCTALSHTPPPPPPPPPPHPVTFKLCICSYIVVNPNHLDIYFVDFSKCTLNPKCKGMHLKYLSFPRNPRNCSKHTNSFTLYHYMLIYSYISNLNRIRSVVAEFSLSQLSYSILNTMIQRSRSRYISRNSNGKSCPCNAYMIINNY